MIHMPRGALAILPVAMAFALCGCERDHIEVTIEPRPDGSFMRTIRLWHTDPKKKGQILAPPEALVEHARRHYQNRLEAEGAAVCFQGTFRAVPPDLRRGEHTNRGGYTVWRSPLGQVGYYRERRPGRTDHYTRFRKAADVVDLLVRLLATAARQQLGGEKGLDRLLAFIEGELRRDLKEILFFLSHATLDGPTDFRQRHDEESGSAIAAYVLQFLEERGYVEAADVPRLFASDGATDLVASLIAKKMGRPADGVLRQKLKALTDPERGEAALRASLKELGMSEEEFEKAMEPLLDGIFDLKLRPDPELRYVLVLPREAEVRHTNGRAEKKSAHLAWRGELGERPVAGLYFALWSVPDAAWQRQRLGRAALRGDKLVDYVLWESSLAPEPLGAWRAALDRLDPRGDLVKQLNAIRITKPGDEAEAEKGAKLIIQALKAAEQ